MFATLHVFTTTALYEYYFSNICVWKCARYPEAQLDKGNLIKKTIGTKLWVSQRTSVLDRGLRDDPCSVVENTWVNDSDESDYEYMIKINIKCRNI